MKNSSTKKHTGENSKQGDFTRSSNKKTPWCSYCNNPGHERDKCQKLHGRRQNPTENWSNRGGQKQVYMAKTKEIENLSTEFNHEEIEKFKNLLGALEKPSTPGTYTSAFSGRSSTSHAFNVLNKVFSNAGSLTRVLQII